MTEGEPARHPDFASKTCANDRVDERVSTSPVRLRRRRRDGFEVNGRTEACLAQAANPTEVGLVDYDSAFQFVGAVIHIATA